MNRLQTVFLIGAVFLSGFSSTAALAQSRMTDKDVEVTMKNLKEDAKIFRSAFNSSVRNSTIRKTSREKETKAQVADFQKQTESMLKLFKSTKKAEADLRMVLSSADRIDGLLHSVDFDARTTGSWGKVRSDLDILSGALNLPGAPPTP